MYFCAARLEKDQTKRGSDALHPFPHSSSLRGNRWRDAPRLRHCSVDAEHPVKFSIFGGSTGRLTTYLRVSWLSEPGVSIHIHGRLRTRQEKTPEVFLPSELCAPRLMLPPKVGSV